LILFFERIYYNYAKLKLLVPQTY